MNLLLDTHIWLWWINQDNQLSDKHKNQIAEAKNVFVSSVSCWELVMLHQRQRIDLSGDFEDWFSIALAGANIVCLPITAAIAIKSACLDFHHRDPADRFIIATSLVNDCHLMSFDDKFLLYPELEARLLGKV